MADRPRKAFFKDPLVSEVKSGRTERQITDRFVEQIESLPSDQYALIQARIIPAGARHFMHHGNLVNLDYFLERDEVLRTFGEVFSRALGILDSRPTYGYRNMSPFGNQPRIIPWVNCLEAARIFGYAHKAICGLRPIDITTYDGTLSDEERIESKRINVSTEGGMCIAEVPSRRKGVSRYFLKIHHVPVEDNQYKFEIALATFGETASQDQIHDLRFEGEFAPRPSERHLVSGLEAAAMLAIAEHYLKEKNPLPSQLCPIFIPSKKLANFYMNLIKQCLVQIPGKSEVRILNMTERSKLIGAFIWINGYQEASWNKGIDGKLKDYEW